MQLLLEILGHWVKDAFGFVLYAATNTGSVLEYYLGLSSWRFEKGSGSILYHNHKYGHLRNSSANHSSFYTKLRGGIQREGLNLRLGQGEGVSSGGSGFRVHERKDRAPKTVHTTLKPCFLRCHPKNSKTLDPEHYKALLKTPNPPLPTMP